jgi:hypothetical protein
MVVENFFLEVMAVLFSAIFSYIAVYLVYKRFSVAVWAYIAAFIPRIPIAIVSMTGGTNLIGLAWLSHTLGIIVYPMILVIADILLLEIALVRLVKPIAFILPKSVQTAIKAESMLSVLQEYHAVPRPERIQWVYGAGIYAGIINLVFVMGFGLL